MGSAESRFDGLRSRRVAGVRVPVAERFVSRLLGLALLERTEAGAGLLIPRCRCVHTFGMRFALDLVFLDPEGREIRRVHAVPARAGGAGPPSASARARARPPTRLRRSVRNRGR